MALDITQVILQDILKISTDLLREYSSIGDQLIYLILVPSVILLLFVYVFGGWIAGNHPRFHYLITIVAYIFIIYTGWYGSFIVPIVINWFAITLGLAFLFFIITKVIHPVRGKAIYELSGAAGKRVKELTVGKSKSRKEIDRQIEETRKNVASLQSKIDYALSTVDKSGKPKQRNKYLANTYEMRKNEYEEMLRQLKAKREAM